MAFLLYGCAVLFVLGVTILRSLMKARRYPPGPPGFPVLGNFHKLNHHEYRYRHIEDISKTYGPPEVHSSNDLSVDCTIGDVIFFYNPTMSVLVLSSYRSMQDLLGNRGSIYSDRPRSSLIDM
jgi:hypothetical protein